MTTVAEIDAWRASPEETAHLEFKEAKNAFDFEKLCEYCVALANEGGGHLILGVADKLPRAVVGTAAFTKPAELIARIFSKLHFRCDVDEVVHPNGRVVIVNVPSRPRGRPYEIDGRYLMRAGSSLVAMSGDLVRPLSRISSSRTRVLEAHGSMLATSPTGPEFLFSV